MDKYTQKGIIVLTTKYDYPFLSNAKEAMSNGYQSRKLLRAATHFERPGI